MKYFKLKIIFSVFLIFSLYHCNLSPNLNSNIRFYGLLSFLYTYEYASVSTIILSGTLYDANGLALDSATILVSNKNLYYNVQPKESVSKSTVANSNGEFSLYLKEGNFNLKFSKSNNEYLGYLNVLLKYPYNSPILESQEGKIIITNLKLSSINSSSMSAIPPANTAPSTPPTVINPNSE